MSGFITAEGLVIPIGSDTYDYVNDQRRLASSIRSVVSAPDRTTADSIATAMNTDGRPVTDANPLVVWRTDLKAIEVKGASGWWTTGPKSAYYTAGASAIPANSLWGVGGSGGFTASTMQSNDFVTVSGEVFTFSKPGSYLVQTLAVGAGAPPSGWYGYRKGDDSVTYTENGFGAGTSYALTHTGLFCPTAANDTFRFRILTSAIWNTNNAYTTITKIS